MHQISEDPLTFRVFFKLTRWLWLGILLTLLGWLFQEADQYQASNSIRTDRIQTELIKQTADLDSRLEQMIDAVDSFDLTGLIDHPVFSFLLYRKDSLLFWSDNTLVLPEDFVPANCQEGFVKWPNVFAICRMVSQDDFTAIGLVKLQYRYPFENEYLSNVFLPKVKRHGSYQISADGQGVEIVDAEGHNSFSLSIKAGKSQGFLWFLSMLTYFAGLLFLIYFLIDLLGYGRRLWNSGWWLVFLAADLFLFRWLIYWIGVPDLFYEWDIFRLVKTDLPFLDSLGEMTISLVFILFYTIAFRRYFRLYPKGFNRDMRQENPRVVDGFTAIGWIIVWVTALAVYQFWFWINEQAQSIIEINNLLSLSSSEIFVSVLMILSGCILVLVLKTIVRETSRLYPVSRQLVFPLVIGIILLGILRATVDGFDLVHFGLILFVLVVGSFLFQASSKKYSAVWVLLFLGVASVYTVYFLNFSNQLREKEMQKELIVNLTNEHDPIAEMILQRMDQDILNDTVLLDMIRNPQVPEDDIEDYLISNRFGSYWSRYSINVNVCDSVNMMLIAPENIEVPCLTYWENIRKRDGQQLGQSHFYYLDNFDGKIWYLGKIPVPTLDSSYVYHLWISAESLLTPEGLGYPDLLISGDNSRDTLKSNYSWAKYQNCQLISRTGEYSYASSCEVYPSNQEDITYFEAEGYGHWLSRLDADSMVLMSKPLNNFFAYLISFSYLFVTFYLIWALISAILFLPRRIRERGWDMKSKIQITMVSILVFSFLLIGGGLTYFVVNQYNSSSKNAIYEKIQSVLTEVQHKLEMERSIQSGWSTPDYPNLQSLLVKFSYVFNSDIHMYNPQGRLVASSRPEVFQRLLTGELMDPEAYNQLAKMKKMEFIHRENIGSLGYWSAYVPFYNLRGELLAYLNLPYFSQQTEIRRDITNFLVAMLNGYFLLIFLAVVLAVVLGNQVTKPLQMLKERFSGVHLGVKNTEIQYRRNDEIGSLVKAYNQMLKELEASAELLARSERELAWREMAKQIAHEIKNPLTPMKLSVQHLKRSWDDRVENWDDYLNRVTKTLVEQIDSLTAIANEFSQFAKMPKANRERVDLAERVESAIALFKESESAHIELDLEEGRPIHVLVDREQILQVFNNLIMNAIQSVPAGRTPKISIKLQCMGGNAVVSVSDNGSGIPAELKEKLFQPNFTTKSSGMGLGLAITRNILENSDGRIWFDSGMEGTTFHVELPLV